MLNLNIFVAVNLDVMHFFNLWFLVIFGEIVMIKEFSHVRKVVFVKVTS